MITKSEAIKLGVAAYQGADREKENAYNERESVWSINGTLHRILGNLWYDVFPAKLREKFNYSYEEYIKQVEKELT